MRREWDLLPEDAAFLEATGYNWETIKSGQWSWILIHGYPTGHSGYSPSHVTVAIRLEANYPDGQLDMAYFHPPIKRNDGKGIGATEHKESIDGKSFQRWSRHRTAANPWKPGEDNLETHMLLVQDWLAREFQKWAA